MSDSIKKRHGPEALIEAFRGLVRPPDGLGEIHNLSRSEARAIRACGYKAPAACYGRVWRCPELPDELVRWTEFFYLSDVLSRVYGYRPGEWHPKRAALLPIPAPREDQGKPEKRLLASVHKAHRVRKCELQRKHWRLSAAIFNHTLKLLVERSRVNVAGGWVYFVNP